MSYDLTIFGLLVIFARHFFAMVGTVIRLQKFEVCMKGICWYTSVFLSKVDTAIFLTLNLFSESCYISSKVEPTSSSQGRTLSLSQ